MTAQIAIIVPGIMGSVLKQGNETIWPGEVSELLFPYKKMDQLMSLDLDPVDVIRSISTSRQYADLIDSMTTCGFDEEGPPKTLFVCPYDWRKPNELAAERLAKMIEDAAHLHNGDLDIFLIGHSMGGLVSRYYLESGGFTQRTGFANVKRLITLGTPHRGAALALSAIAGLEPCLFLSGSQVRQLANDARYPALYQLLPPQGEPFVWDDDPDSQYLPVDIYQPAVRMALKLSAANLDAAREFHARLDLAKRPMGVEYFFFYGTRQATVSTVYFRKTGCEEGRAEGRIRKLELENAGDGTVPVWSGMQPGIQGRPVGGEHGRIYKNGMLRSTLATLMGKKGVLAVSAELPDMAIRDHVTAPDKDVRVVVMFPDVVTSLDAQIKLSRLVMADGHPASQQPYVTVLPIKYSGAPLDKISFVIKAPQYLGIYKVELMVDQNPIPVASDDLFVHHE